MPRVSQCLPAFVLLAAMPTAPAHAYIDPASISMALQVITGAVAGVLVFGKVHLLRIASFFRRKPSAAPVTTTEDQNA